MSPQVHWKKQMYATMVRHTTGVNHTQKTCWAVEVVVQPNLIFTSCNKKVIILIMYVSFCAILLTMHKQMLAKRKLNYQS